MRRISRRTLLGAGAALVAGSRTSLLAQPARRSRVLVGTFTDPLGQNVPDYFRRDPGNRSMGLYAFTLDAATGLAGDIELAAELSNPFNLTVHSNGRVVYACRWPTPRDGGNLTAIGVGDDSFHELSTTESGGGGPNVGCVDRSGHNLLITNFITGSIACFRLRPDGAIGERSALIEEDPGGAHAATLSRDERFAIVPEIQANRCRVLRFEARTGSLEPHQLAPDVPDAGPRHLVWHPNHRYLYTSGELNSSISAWRWNAEDGTLEVIQNLSTLPADFRGRNQPADIAMHPSGRLVYVTNRNTGTLAGFRIDPSSGKLTAVGHADIGSESSWSMVFDATGRWAVAAATMSDEVVMYTVDQTSALLRPTGQRLRVTLPTCVRWI